MPTYLNLNRRRGQFDGLSAPAFHSGFAAHGAVFNPSISGIRNSSAERSYNSLELKCPDVYKHVETCIVCKHALKDSPSLHLDILDAVQRERVFGGGIKSASALNVINSTPSSRVFVPYENSPVARSTDVFSGPQTLIVALGVLIIILLFMILFTKNNDLIYKK